MTREQRDGLRADVTKDLWKDPARLGMLLVLLDALDAADEALEAADRMADDAEGTGVTCRDCGGRLVAGMHYVGCLVSAYRAARAKTKAPVRP